MNSTLKPVENTNYCLLNDKLKLDIHSTLIIGRLKNNKPENFYFNETDKLWYHKNYKSETSIIELLVPNEKIIKIKFKNEDYHDYRFDNIDITKQVKKNDNIIQPKEVEIISEGTPTHITEGAYAGEYRNMYWKVKNNKKEIFYMMYIKEDVYTKFSLKDLDKVIDFNGTRPTWCLSNNGYISCRTKSYEDRKFCYLHQYIMNTHDKDNTNYEETVDHINQDKLDNRRENLRIVSMSEQNKNKDKQKRRKDACDLPNGINVLPKYIEYRKEIYDKENNTQREFFLVNHHTLEKIWETTKSNKVSILDKLKHAKAKLELIEKKITEEQFKEIIGEDEKMDLPIGISLKLKDKYQYVFDLRNGEMRYNAKMILHSTDVQKELDKFIDLVINNKYPNLIKKYKILNPIEIDKELISNEIQIDTNIQKPTYPQYITVYDDKGSMYIQYNRSIKEKRYNKKNKIISNNIQVELDKLVKNINEKYPGYNLEKLTVINPELFKIIEQDDKKKDKEIHTDKKPELPINFSICNIYGIDYFQYCKKNDNKKDQKQMRINSYNIQEEFNKFVKDVNNTFKIKLEIPVIDNSQNWKTCNKIIDNEETDEKTKNCEKAKKSLEKKKAEMGEEAFHALMAQKAKEYREKKKLMKTIN